MIKFCKLCKKDSEFSELGKICISCKALYDKEYYQKNLDKKKAQGIIYSQSHKEEKKIYDKQYKLDNQPKVIQVRKERKAAGKTYIEARRGGLKRSYNITLADYDVLLKLQDGKCAICERTSSIHKNKVLCVDHDHQTGEIRGLLCHNCNIGIGNLQDNIENLKRAIEYLEKSKNI